MLRCVLSFLLIITTAGLTLSGQQSSSKQPLGGANPNVPAAPPPQAPSNRSKDLLFSVEEVENPLKEIAIQVSEQFGIPISYEEPAWLDGPDVMRTLDTPESRKNPKVEREKFNSKLRSSTPGSIQLRVTSNNGQDAFQIVGRALEDLIQDHSNRKNAGDFRLVKLGNYGYSIVPSSIRGAQNQRIYTESPLDNRISFPTEKRLIGDTIGMITKAVSELTGKKIRVVPGSMLADRGFEYAISTIGANNEVARDVLERTLREIPDLEESNPKISWELAYALNGPSALDYGTKVGAPLYVLKFHFVYRKDDTGKSEIVRWQKSAHEKP